MGLDSRFTDLPVGQITPWPSRIERRPAICPKRTNNHYPLALRFLAFLFAAFLGTLSPSALASDRPIAIACLRLVTFLPARPLFNVPALRFFIARSTFADAFFEYFRAMIILPIMRK
jgi:hypothetical protein